MSLPGIETAALDCVAFEPQSRWLVAGGGALTRRKNKPSVQVRELIAWNLPAGDVRWHVIEEADGRIADLAVRPDSGELATKGTGEISVWSADGKLLRTISSEFLAGPITFSSDGKLLVAPEGNNLKVRSASTGKVVTQVQIAKSNYTSAEAAAFIPGTAHLLVAARVINNKGQTSGKLLLVDHRQKDVLKSTNIDFDPDRVAVDPQGEWAAIAGTRRNRGWILFWDLDKWRRLTDQGAHGLSIDALTVSPDGRQIATTGADHVVRLWDATTWKTVAKLEHHLADGSGSAGVAWSPDGNYLAFACCSAPPSGGVFLYIHSPTGWELFGPSKPAATAKTSERAADLRHVRIYGSDVTMDTVGNYSLSANRWPVKCQQCTLPDIDAVPQPYLLSRGISAPGDFSTAELGNFFVRQRARDVVEIAARGACRFYPTLDAKSRQPTDWFLAVPQTMVPTAELPENYVRCSACGAPKAVSHLERTEFKPPSADVFKSLQWTCWQIGEEAKWYVEGYLKIPREKIPPGQWTRLRIDRELWMSSRLLLLMKQVKLKGLDYASALENHRPTPEEAAWIADKIDQIRAAAPPPPAAAPDGDAAAWLRDYLAKNPAKKPLATPEAVAAWEQKHGIKLPAAYRNFVITIGRHRFADMFGMEGYDVWIVGPKDLDAREYRRDQPEDPSEEAEPDGLLFAVAVNGDALCFDLRGGNGNYPVYHFNHETTAFESFAADFASAVRRLVEQR